LTNEGPVFVRLQTNTNAMFTVGTHYTRSV